MITLDLQGIEAVAQHLAQLGRPPTQILGDALYAEGNRIMGESVQLVPVLTGLLRSTAHVERPVQAGASVTVELSYGSHGTAPYAAIVHFPIRPVHHPHGQSHYLQLPLFAATAGFVDRIAAPLRAALRT
jgi:hypothetical protein